jgi:predicted DNA-binding transcriptional regulator AlpA
MEQTTFKLYELCGYLRLSKSTIYKLIKIGDFPPAIKLTEKTSIWLKADADNWLKSKIEEARGVAA